MVSKLSSVSPLVSVTSTTSALAFYSPRIPPTPTFDKEPENAAFAKCPKLTLTIPHNSYIEEFCTKGRLKYIFSDAEQ